MKIFKVNKKIKPSNVKHTNPSGCSENGGSPTIIWAINPRIKTAINGKSCKSGVDGDWNYLQLIYFLWKDESLCTNIIYYY